MDGASCDCSGPQEIAFFTSASQTLREKTTASELRVNSESSLCMNLLRLGSWSCVLGRRKTTSQTFVPRDVKL